MCKLCRQVNIECLPLTLSVLLHLLMAPSTAATGIDSILSIIGMLLSLGCQPGQSAIASYLSPIYQYCMMLRCLQILRDSPFPCLQRMKSEGVMACNVNSCRSTEDLYLNSPISEAAAALWRLPLIYIVFNCIRFIVIFSLRPLFKLLHR